jgi:hypothetical protein
MNNQNNINDLLDLRENIVQSVQKIEFILRTNFQDQYEDAYQHWIPQILTALFNDLKWLPRGEVNMQKTIDRILDKINQESGSGVSKFIK